MKKYLVLLGVIVFGCNSPEISIDKDKFNIEEITIDKLQEGMNSGKFTSEEIVNIYLERIDNLDKNGPNLNSIIEINPDAINQAIQCDLDRRNKKALGRLHGIPVIIKDNIDTGDKMMTSGGSLALFNHFAKDDADIIKQLRESGAIILGKANLSEWANFRSTTSSSGWSSRGGQTRNPYNTLYSPCGSSAGSAVSVAANLCTIAIGTETNGSIGCPSSVNGIVGIKPTVGLWSRKGIIPISHTQDTAGPMARTVKDAAILLSACVDLDSDDPTMDRPREKGTDYTIFCNEDGLKNKRIGIDSNYFDLSGDMGIVFKHAINQIENEGAEVIYIDYLHSMGRLWNHEMNVLLYEFKDGLNKYLTHAEWKINSLKELISYNESHADSIMPIFGQELFLRAEAKDGLSSPEYQNAVDSLLLVTRYVINNTINSYDLDALLGPSTGPSWKIDHEDGDDFNGPSAYGISAMAGYPYITVPMGKIDGLPVGLAFMGRAYEEGKLIELAYAYEQASQKRIKPDFE